MDDKLTSEEWLTLREVAVVYEVLGVLLKHGFLNPNVLFDTFYLNPPGARGDRNVTLWQHVNGIIKGMRGDYNPEDCFNNYLYVNWEYLTNEEAEYLERKRGSPEAPK